MARADDLTLDVRGLETRFLTPKGPISAIRDVSIQVRPGEIVGLVGESGSGKSVTGLSIMGLIDAPGEVVDGEVLLNGGGSSSRLALGDGGSCAATVSPWFSKTR